MIGHKNCVWLYCGLHKPGFTPDIGTRLNTSIPGTEGVCLVIERGGRDFYPSAWLRYAYSYKIITVTFFGLAYFETNKYILAVKTLFKLQISMSKKNCDRLLSHDDFTLLNVKNKIILSVFLKYFLYGYNFT